MRTDKELADAVVALGVGQKDEHQKILPYQAPMDIDGQWSEANEFVRDWRVAGALMEKTKDHILIYESCDQWHVGWDLDQDGCPVCEVHNEPLPRAIIEACVEALNG